MNYYNEFDPGAAAWLRELIKRKLIPDGEVDERSIADVRADDLAGFVQCHFFAGVGGWPLALRLAGWPEDKPVWTGSCPCQSFSNAGKQKGAEDERDLWPVFFELIRACRPEFVFGEQVEAAITHGWLDRVCANLETENYAVGACVLGAHSVAAPHQRQRLYWGAERVEHSPLLGSGKGQSHARGGSCGGGKEQRAFVERASGGTGGLAQDPSIIGRGGRCDGDSAGDDGEVQAERLGDGERVAHGDLPGCGECGRGEPVFSECATAKLDSIYGLSPWSDFAVINCTDNKVRRIPAQSVFLGVADGVSEGVDGGGNCGLFEDAAKGFPLAKKIEGQNMLLKGYGNAIVPQCAAAFVAEFMREN